MKDELTEGSTARYWLDNDVKNVKNGMPTSGMFDIDITGLGMGLHAIHYQTINETGIPSATRTRYFMKDEQLTATTARYWIDNDIKNVKTGVATSGLIDICISDISSGIHAIHYQTMDETGIPSATRTKYFYASDVQSIDGYTARIWIDDDEDNAKTYVISDNIIEIDLGELTGEHLLHIDIYNADNEIIYKQTITFNAGGDINGDANNDGVVNVTDIVATVNYIMNKPSADFNFETADVNKDGFVNVTDIVGMVNIIMKNGTQNVREIMTVLRRSGFVF